MTKTNANVSFTLRLYTDAIIELGVDTVCHASLPSYTCRTTETK